MTSIKILYIIDNIYKGGGTEQQLYYLVCGLKKISPYEITIFHLKEDPQDFDFPCQGIETCFISHRARLNPITPVELYKKIRKLKPHIVQTQLITADLYGRIAASLAGVPIIITSLRGLYTWKRARHLAIDRLLDRSTTHYTANAQAIKTHFMKLLGIPERKITTIYNGVSSDLAAVTPEKIKSLRETLQIEEGVSVVGMLSRYSWHKDFPVFFRAAAIVRKKHPRVCFLTAGGGPLQEYRQMLEKMDPGSPIKMLGFQSAPEVLLSILNILCLSTKQEGCSNVILEAMAGGIPVVATAVGGNPELVEEGVTGLLAPPEDAPSLAERILRLLENPGLARQMAEAGKNKAKTYFSCEKMVASYQGLYERLCAQHLHLS